MVVGYANRKSSWQLQARSSELPAFVDQGGRRLVDGWWSMATTKGGRRLVDGEWSIVVGRWSIVDGRNGVLLIVPRVRRIRRSPLELRAQPNTHGAGASPATTRADIRLRPPVVDVERGEALEMRIEPRAIVRIVLSRDRRPYRFGECCEAREGHVLHLLRLLHVLGPQLRLAAQDVLRE